MYRYTSSIRLIIFSAGLILFVFNAIGQHVINIESVLPACITTPLQQPGAKNGYDEPSRTWYSIYNDDKAIYIQLTVTDLIQQKKIIENGVELWIDARGKKKKNTGIEFPFYAATNGKNNSMPMNAPFAFTENDTQRINEMKNMRLPLKAKAAAVKEMKVMGFANDLNGIQNSDHPSGLHVSMTFINDTTLSYSAVIPLHTLARPVALNTGLAIGIVEKGLQGFAGDGMGPGFDGPGGEGMMPPPGPPPGEGSNTDGHFEQLLNDNILWVRYTMTAVKS